MIERDVLLRLAREFAEEKGRARPTLVAGFLTGSVARAEPPLGDATDIDISLIDYDPPESYEPYVRLSDTVLIDYSYSHPQALQDKRMLRQHPLLGPSLYDAVPLYDPRHVFDLLQASVRGQFDEPENVYARARRAYGEACECFDTIARFRAEPVPVPLDRDELHSLHAVYEWVATAVLMITFRSHSHRRHMMQFEAAAIQLEQPQLHRLALRGLGYADLNADAIAELRAQWLEIYQAANRFHAGPWDEDRCLHPTRELYYLRGFETLAEAGHAHNSLLLLEHTLAACANQILTHAPPEAAAPYLESYAAWLTRTKKGSAEEFAERVTLAGELLGRVDELLNSWARDEGVPL